MIEFKNRFIFAPIKLGYCDGSGLVNDRHINFYNRRSKYLGAVTPEPFYLDSGLRELPTQLGIDNDDKITGLKRLVDTIHRDNTKVIAHLNHPGRMANPKLPNNYFLSSTDKACENGGATPKKMNKKDMSKVISQFEMSAKRAKDSGFDIIELQLGHGYLLAQFLSPFVNDRDDEFGGSFKNRIKFPLEIIKAVKKAVDLPIIARISADEMIPNGIKLPEMIEFSKILEKNGIEIIHVSAGSICSTPPWYFGHMFTPKGKTWEMAKKIKSNVNIAVEFVGRINTFADIEELKDSADFISIGRALVADPDFLGKYLNSEVGLPRPCLACSDGCLGGVKAGTGLKCLVNPLVGKEDEVLKATVTPKKYAVIGGGLAGMEAAVTLRKLGHSVDLYEKNRLGGQFNYAPLTKNKEPMTKLLSYYIKDGELDYRDVHVINKEAIASDIIANYDGVILATGSTPAIPKIESLKDFHWAEVLEKENLPESKNILIIGGGLIGVDIATGLISRNNKIIIVKRTTDFGEDMEMIAKKLSLKQLKESGTVFSDHTNIEKIDGKTVYAIKEDKKIKFENIDMIIISTGMKSYNPLEKKLEGKISLHVIGDAKKVGKAQDAITDGFNIAKNL